MKTVRIKAEVDQGNRIVGYIDERTGQEYGFPVIFGRKKNPYSKGWIMNSQDALDILAEDKDIKGVTYRVVFSLKYVQESILKTGFIFQLKKLAMN